MSEQEKVEHFKSLVRKRASVKSRLTIFKNYICETLESGVINSEKLIEIQLRVSRQEIVLQEYEDIQYEIEASTDDLDEQLIERESFEKTHFAYIAKAKKILADNATDTDTGSGRGSPAHTVASSRSQRACNVRLPAITLPHFDGTFSKWCEFIDQFNSIIDSNVDLSDAQKFSYLRASLRGEAEEVIQSLVTCDTNYAIAFDLLKERYENKRRIINAHSKALLELSPMTKESHSALSKLINTTQQHLRGLKALGQSVDEWDALIVPLIASKLDPTTNKEWETKVNSHFLRDQIPTMKDLTSFLSHKFDILESLIVNKSPPQSHDISNRKTLPKAKEQRSFFSFSQSCSYCSESTHSIYNCSNFLKLPVHSRLDEIKKNKLCGNCLRRGHFIKECKSGPCRKCKLKHNTLVHFETPDCVLPDSTLNSQNTIKSLSAHAKTGVSDMLFATAQIQIADNQGAYQACTAILDSGSQSNFISNDLCNKLGLAKTTTQISIVGINQSTSTTNSKCEVSIKSRISSYTANASCLVVPKITDFMPSYRVNTSHLDIPKNLVLADPEFNNPKSIDLLLGLDLFWKLLSFGQHSLGANQPDLQKTKFGWIVSGPIGSSPSKLTHCNFGQTLEVQEQLAKFWEIEEIPSNRVLSSEERFCEEHFLKTVQRDSYGRFIVSIPLKESLSKLGDSKEQAARRFYALERKLQRNPLLRERYLNFMEEYQSMNHMTMVDDTNDQEVSYYMPHHGVIKESSMTTKLRVVFDGSCPSTSGYSINDLQMVGPTIQNELLTILIRFRQHSIVISADIEKMYRQVLVAPALRDTQRILWRPDPTQSLFAYRLNTVTYGTSAASFLAIRCLQKLAEENVDRFPRASHAISNDFYVDDFLSSYDNVEEASLVANQVTDILKQGCFNLRKWVSNDPEAIKQFQTFDSSSDMLELGPKEDSKTLGLLWSPQPDCLMYNISSTIPRKTITKRIILSEIAQIFDPLGLLSACTITAKIILQQLWAEGKGWDESISSALHVKWSTFRNELVELNQLRIPRHVACVHPIKVELHYFSDASEAAYGACAYVRSITSCGHIHVHLLCAKSKVAPLKPTTVPRLELNGALMAARISERIAKSLSITPNECFFWSDSMIVLAWLKTPANLLKTYVGNRVAEIQDLSNPSDWRHVATKENPADLLSRGVNPASLHSSKLWWCGPPWLSLPISKYPDSSLKPDQNLPELKKQIQSLMTTEAFDIFTKYSSLSKIKKVIAYCYRFYRNCKLCAIDRNVGPVNVAEQSLALVALLKLAQLQCFANEIHCLARNKPLKSSSRLLALKPFLDDSGLLRVGGRISNSNFEYDKCHQIILPSKHLLTNLIATHAHQQQLHCGSQALLYSLRQAYWPIAGRSLTRKIVHCCIPCFRNNPSPNQCIMGDLPAARVTPSPAFYNCGVDYAGPFLVRDKKTRGSKSFKCYICLFICFSTKAVHLELVSDLTSECFLASLRRFTSRRGKPAHIYSDNGSTFLGAKNELQRLGDFIAGNQNDMLHAFHNEGITWHFIPAYSPHQGGLWESGIKSAKHHLKRVVGNALLTFENFCTLLTQIEAILNSRPLSPLSSDPNDLEPLTPGHFLIGRPLVSVADPSVTHIANNRLSDYQHVQQLQQHFWSRWSTEYLSGLQERTKWKKGQPHFEIGSLVLLKEDNLPPQCWRLGRITQLHPGADNITRVVSVKTAKGILKRAVVKVCVFPQQCGNSIKIDVLPSE